MPSKQESLSLIVTLPMKLSVVKPTISEWLIFVDLEKLRNPNLKFVNKEKFPFLNNLCIAKNDCNSYDM